MNRKSTASPSSYPSFLALTLLLGLWPALSLLLTACRPTTPQIEPGSQNPASQAAAEPPTIGLAISTLANPFFVAVKEGAEESAQRLGVTLLIADAKDDPALQTRQIQDFIDKRVNALLINPVGSEAIIPAVQAANAAGIPVFTIDRSAGGGTVVSHIASDNQAGGEMAGNYLAELLTRKGSVVELEGIPGTSAATDRGAGFNRAIAAYPDLKIVARQVANFNRAEAKTVFAKILAEHPDINAVFAHNDEMILGAIEAAEESNRGQNPQTGSYPAGIAFIGFDAIDEAIDALESGRLAATIAQQPAEMGRLGVETAFKLIQGADPTTIPPFIPVDLALVTR